MANGTKPHQGGSPDMNDETNIAASAAAEAVAPFSLGKLHPLLLALHATRKGSLDVTLPDGRRISYSGTTPGTAADIQFRDWEYLSRILTRGDVGLGEGYVEGGWETRDLDALLRFAADNMDAFRILTEGNILFRLAHRVQRGLLDNSKKRSRRNVHRHYDLGNEFYSLWLDPGMTYSCALFEGDATRSLDAAQLAKYRRILTQLQPTPGSSILEFGCGWGGFLEEAAKAGHQIVGVTLSPQQAGWAENRIVRLKLTNRAEVLLRDYRDMTGLYDHVVSIGMFEHVGQEYWAEYMNNVYMRLKPGGSAMIQSIIVRDDLFESYRAGTDFLREHIFPGGMLPSRRKFVEYAQNAGLTVRDVYEFGQDYAITVSRWLERFEQNLPNIRRLGYDDAFIRKWRFYLASCIAMFRAGRVSVMQVRLEKN